MNNDERNEQVVPDCYKAKFTCINNKPRYVSAKQRERAERAQKQAQRKKRLGVIGAIVGGVVIGLIFAHAGYILYFICFDVLKMGV